MTPTTIIDHSIVGSALGAWYFFRDQTGIESHFIVRGAPSGSQDGRIWQLMDTGRRADANLDANAFAISIQTEDKRRPRQLPLVAGAAGEPALVARQAAGGVHPTIPRRRCPGPRGGGLGFHSMWGAPSPWTPVVGKLLALDTLVPTPDGLRALREIAVGSVVFDERGEPCNVTATYEDLPERAWRVVFGDGLEVLAGGEHQWVTITRGQRKGYFRRDRPRDQDRGPRPEGYPLDWARWGDVRDTDEIASTLLASDGGYQHTIPVARPLRLGERDLPIDPYLLGVWLGDGGERDGVITAGFDPDDLMPSDAEFLLGRKHVPEGYLFGSAEQRLALLQGLMDTGGQIGDKRTVEFVSESEDLADAVVWLASSLGQRVRKAKGGSSPAWRELRTQVPGHLGQHRPVLPDASQAAPPCRSPVGALAEPLDHPVRTGAGAADAVPHGGFAELDVPHHRPVSADPQHLPREAGAGAAVGAGPAARVSSRGEQRLGYVRGIQR